MSQGITGKPQNQVGLFCELGDQPYVWGNPTIVILPHHSVILANAGIQKRLVVPMQMGIQKYLCSIDSRLRGNDRWGRGNDKGGRNGRCLNV